MKKRIFGSMLAIAIMSALLLSVSLSMVYYGVFSEQAKSEIRDRTAVLKNILDLKGSADASRYFGSDSADVRVTLISVDGTVVYDNAADAASLENHSGRQEVAQALLSGVGENERMSASLGHTTYYYAVRLADGSVLRLSRTTSSIFGVYLSVLPLTLLVLLIITLLTYVASAKMTARIIAPINEMDLDRSASPVYEELVPFTRKIFKQNEFIASQQQALDGRAATMRAITANLKEGLILLDAKGRIISVNQSAADLFDTEAARAEGKNILELTRNPGITDSFKQAAAGNDTEIHFEKSGRHYRIYFSHSSGGGVLVIALDITEKYSAETARREFSANVSHELKTPLTTISGYAELISKGMIPVDESSSASAKIKAEADRLVALIDDIIMLSQLDESASLKETDNFDLAALAREVTDNLRQKAGQAEVTLEAAPDSLVIKANRHMMYELLYNLMDNGIKYNRKGGKVTLQAVRGEGGKAVITVSDTGIGIPAEHIGRVFERFYRVDKSRSKKTGGTGLGLSIVKHIASYHGGSVSISSEEGKGTTVKVII